MPIVSRQWRRPPDSKILGGPWIFSQVCSRWRTLAISLPTLWTDLTVSTNLLPREVTLLNIQLTRSGNAPLNLLIRFNCHFGASLRSSSIYSWPRRCRTAHVERSISTSTAIGLLPKPSLR
ncbi:hypothetical protein B0H19DRAFT_1154712 [Mycena capillaripes]|nr:hypothetical protein B0H19DRAFT_1154712 [Mycena capillaripes]